MNGLYVPIATDEQSIANTSFVHETAYFKDKPPFLNCAPKVGHDNIQYERIKVSN